MIYKLQGGGVGKYISTEKGKCYGVGCADNAYNHYYTDILKIPESTYNKNKSKYKILNGTFGNANEASKNIVDKGGEVIYDNYLSPNEVLDLNKVKVGDFVSLQNPKYKNTKDEYRLPDYYIEKKQFKNKFDPNSHLGVIDSVPVIKNGKVSKELGVYDAIEDTEYLNRLSNRNGKYFINRNSNADSPDNVSPFFIAKVTRPYSSNKKDPKIKESYTKEELIGLNNETLKGNSNVNTAIQALNNPELNDEFIRRNLPSDTATKLKLITLGQGFQESNFGNSPSYKLLKSNPTIQSILKAGKVGYSNLISSLAATANGILGLKHIPDWEKEILIKDVKNIEEAKKNKAKFDSRFKLSPTLQAQASMHKNLSDADIVRQYGSPEVRKQLNSFDESDVDYDELSKGIYQQKDVPVEAEVLRKVNKSNLRELNSPKATESALFQNLNNYRKVNRIYPNLTDEEKLYLTAAMYNSPVKIRNKKYVEAFLKDRDIDYSNKVYNYADKNFNVQSYNSPEIIIKNDK